MGLYRLAGIAAQSPSALSFQWNPYSVSTGGSSGPIFGAISLLAMFTYLVATALLGRRLMRAAQGVAVAKPRTLLPGVAAALLHGIVSYHSLFGHGALNLGFFNALSLVAWIMVVLMLIVALDRPVESVGILLYPLAAVTVTLDGLFRAPQVLGHVWWGLDAHIVISLLAYSVLSVASLQAILLAVQHHHLRNKHPGGLVRALPPLQIMETLLFQMITVGFVLLSLALITGLFFLHDIFDQHLVHKTVLSIIAWVVFAVLLWGRWRFGWRGPVAIRWTLGGIFSLMLAYFGTKLVLDLILHRVAG
jgi:ABC-type uncharacterized transport system permease subunit